jgi:hypothetical protein
VLQSLVFIAAFLFAPKHGYFTARRLAARSREASS